MKKILIIQNKFIGDVLASSVIANNLKKIYPNSEIHFFCYKQALDVLKGNPNIDRVISFDDVELKKFKVLKKYASLICKENYDILIDPYAKLQSRYITWRSGAKQRVSYNKPIFRHLYTDLVNQADTTQMGYCKALEDRLKLLKPFCNNLTQLDYSFKLFLSEEEKEEGKQLMQDAGLDMSRPTFMLGILGSSPLKSWSLERMAQLIDFIQANYDVNILFNYIPKQQDSVDLILKNLNSKNKIYPHLIGKSVREYLKIMSNCDAYIGNEGGGINMAKALNKKTFSIYSPHKFPEIWGCMESRVEHSSVHLRQLRPDLYINPDLKLYEEKAATYYDLLTEDFVIEKLSEFLSQNFPAFESKQIVPSQHQNISALVITKNEEENILAYLSEVDKFADEIIVVDSFSTDRTVELAKRNPKVKVYQRKFDNFSSQRNFALEKAQYDWVTFYDADERLPQALIAEILHTVRTEKNISSFYNYRKFYVQNNRLKYSGWQNDKAIRLFRKSCCRYNDEFLVHEILECDKKPGKLKTKLDHYSYKSFENYKEKLFFYSKLRAEELFEKKVRPNFFHFYIKPGFRFFHHYILRFGFLDGLVGFKMSKLLADYVHKRYVYLDELWENQ